MIPKACKSFPEVGFPIVTLRPHGTGGVRSGQLRLIELKGLAGSTGTILLTQNERRVAEDRRDCYWLYVVTDCLPRRGTRRR
ncbi:MAG: DUF3883 domain-containing protein [bacterium]